MTSFPYPEFESLRLTTLLRRDREIARVADFEWMGGTWEGEAIGFTGFWCLHGEPGRVGGVEVSLPELDQAEQKRVLIALRLPLDAGMDVVRLRSIFGDPVEEHRFVKDRVSYEFAVGDMWPYRLGCTVHEDHGLIHLSLIRADVLARCTAK